MAYDWSIPRAMVRHLRDGHSPVYKLDLWRWLEAALTPDDDS